MRAKNIPFNIDSIAESALTNPSDQVVAWDTEANQDM